MNHRALGLLGWLVSLLRLALDDFVDGDLYARRLLDLLVVLLFADSCVPILIFFHACPRFDYIAGLLRQALARCRLVGVDATGAGGGSYLQRLFDSVLTAHVFYGLLDVGLVLFNLDSLAPQLTNRLLL